MNIKQAAQELYEQAQVIAKHDYQSEEWKHANDRQRIIYEQFEGREQELLAEVEKVQDEQRAKAA